MLRVMRIVQISVLILALMPTLAWGQSAEQIEEERAIGVVRAIQAGDAGALLAIMHESWGPPEPGSDRDTRWKRIAEDLTERHGDIVILGVEVTEPHQVTIVTEDPDDLELRFIFEFETSAPHSIIQMGVEAGGGGGGGPDLPPIEIPEDASTDQLTSVLDAWFEELAADELFSGTALIAWDGEPVYRGAWGLASREWNAPNRVDTRFDLGSINKSFTKIAIGQLAATGKLTLDDHIADHLPDYPNSDAAGKITIRHLLEHTSGLGDIFTNEFFESSKALYRSPQDFFRLFAEKPLLYEPGEKSQYSNAGFMVLGTIIEAASGQDYAEYVQQNIFDPAGMSSTGFFAHDEPEPNVAVGYTRMSEDGSEGELRNNRFHLPIRGNSAGSAQSNVEDMLRFDSALREYRLLDPAYTSWYFGGEEPTGQQNAKPKSDRASAATGIAGGAPGVSATLDSDGKLAVIVLANYDMPITERIVRALFRPLRRALTDK